MWSLSLSLMVTSGWVGPGLGSNIVLSMFWIGIAVGAGWIARMWQRAAWLF